MLSSQCQQAVQQVSPIFGTESRCHFLGLEARLPLPNQNNMEHTQSGMVWTAPLRTNQVWFGFPEYCSHCIGSISKPAQKSLCEHGMNCPLFCRMRHDYMVRFIAPILLYWCYVIGYNVTMPGIQEALTCISYVILVKYPWIERHLNLWQNQVQRCKNRNETRKLTS